MQIPRSLGMATQGECRQKKEKRATSDPATNKQTKRPTTNDQFMTQIKFGTDGWRGLIADDFTFENVRRVAGAIASYLLKNEDSKRGVVVGYDTRFLSDRAARVAAEVIARGGIPVHLANDYVPTPAVSYNVKKLGAAGGVMVTSSHNPWNWNGVKFKAKFGGSATPAIMKSIEEELSAGAMPSGCAASIEEVDLKPAYVEAITQFADLDLIRGANFKIAVDSMYGSGRKSRKSDFGGTSPNERHPRTRLTTCCIVSGESEVVPRGSPGPIARASRCPSNQTRKRSWPAPLSRRMLIQV